MRLFLQQTLYLLGKDKIKLPFMLMVFITSSTLDLLGIGLIGPYIAIISDINIYEKEFEKITTFLGLPKDKESLITWMGFGLLLIFFFKTIFAIWVNTIIVKFSERQHVRLISFLMSSYQSLNYLEYIKRNSSEYIYSIHHLSNLYANHVISPLLRMACDGIVVSVIVGFLAIQNPQALILLVCFIGVILLIYDILFRKKMNYYGEQCNLVSAHILKLVSEGIEGLKEIRVLGKEKYFYNNVVKSANKLASFAIKSTVVSMSLRYLLELTMVAFIVTLVLGTLLLNGDINMLLPVLSMFGVASLRLFPAANIFMQSLMQMRYGKDSVARLFSDVRNLNISKKNNSESFSGDKTKINFKKLTLTNVSFYYPEFKFNALNKVSLEIRSGESIGIIGPSGSGKTTLLDTLLGLLQPEEGSIKFNDVDIKKNLKEWQSKIAYIPQEIFLIDGTLRQNITLGVNDYDVDEIKLNHAIRQARLNDLVHEIPDGVNTILGERGIRFSGGQRQRVALARAFYHEKDILIMDEATSALDNETEAEIVEEIKRLRETKTMIIIAHRLSTLKHCHRIYELKKGTIIKSGNYNQIVSNIINQ